MGKTIYVQAHHRFNGTVLIENIRTRKSQLNIIVNLVFEFFMY